MRRLFDRHGIRTPGLAAVIAALLAVMTPHNAVAQSHDMQGHSEQQMKFDATGMVMNSNTSTLPFDCSEISRDHAFTVHGGTQYAEDFAGTVFGFSTHEHQAEPCSRITVTFINDDQIRHQWMVHGLPKYLYPGGMFHLEAAGGHEQTGTFIVPSDDKTYLIHCDVAQHMEKGMKAQLKVGSGSGDLWSIPEISGNFNHATYLPDGTLGWLLLAGAAGLGFTLLLMLLMRFRKAR